MQEIKGGGRRFLDTHAFQMAIYIPNKHACFHKNDRTAERSTVRSENQAKNLITIDLKGEKAK